MRMIPEWPCDTGTRAEKRMFESLTGARLDHEAEAKARATLGG